MRYSGPDPPLPIAALPQQRALVTLCMQLASYPPPVPHSPPVDAGVGWASAAATAAVTSSRMRLRTAASDSGTSPPTGAGADEGGGEARSRSVMTRRREN